MIHGREGRDVGTESLRSLKETGCKVQLRTWLLWRQRRCSYCNRNEGRGRVQTEGMSVNRVVEK